MSGTRKYFEGWAHVNVTMPTPLFERFNKFVHESSRASGKLVSKSDVINELVRNGLDGLRIRDEAA